MLLSWWWERPGKMTVSSTWKECLCTRLLKILPRWKNLVFCILVWFISYPLMCICVTKESKVLISSNQHNVVKTVIFYEKDRQRRSFWTKLSHRAGELIDSSSRTVMVYCWLFQLKANYFWWSFLDRYQEKGISSCIPCARRLINLFK